MLNPKHLSLNPRPYLLSPPDPPSRVEGLGFRGERLGAGCRLILGITGGTIWVIGVMNLLTKSA